MVSAVAPVLLPTLISAVAEEAVAALTMTEPAGVAGSILATTTKVADPPEARFGLVAVIAPVPPTAGVVSVHPPGAVALTKVRPAGRLSFTDTFAAASGPALFKT